MYLAKFRIKNFRGYRDAEINFTDFTTFVGINDSGKSTIFEALDIFFKNTKIEKDDRSVFATDDVELIGYFSDLPENIKLETIPTTLDEEYLTLKDKDSNKEYLVLKQRYSGEMMKLSESLVSTFPSDDSVKDIHTLKISALRKKFADLIENVDKRKSTEIRKEALKVAAQNSELVKTEINLNGKESLKDISNVIHTNLPMYQLFKSDRANTDSDSEIQDPIKAIIKTAISREDIKRQLDGISDDINEAVTSITDKTLKMLQEMNASLSNDLSTNFQEPKWSSVFKFNLETDSDIPLNKRGSGVRRLILLNFFRAEARRKLELAENGQDNEVNIIYAFEEPETSQHPKFQKMLIDSFKTMSETEHIQVFITTHSPAIAQIVPKDGIRLVTKKDEEANVVSGEDALNEVVNQLGIVPDIKLYPDQLKCVVCVEGPTDVSFFEYIYQHWCKKSKSEKEKTVFIAGGGGTIVDTVNAHFVKRLRPIKKVTIIDGDQAGTDDKKKITKNNNEIEIIQLSKATIELYLPYEEVSEALKNSKQAAFDFTKDQWTKNNILKLSKAQKRILKNKKVYDHFKIGNLSIPVKNELEGIIQKIDRDD